MSRTGRYSFPRLKAVITVSAVKLQGKTVRLAEHTEFATDRGNKNQRTCSLITVGWENFNNLVYAGKLTACQMKDVVVEMASESVSDSLVYP